jgi:hypothetical protein
VVFDGRGPVGCNHAGKVIGDLVELKVIGHSMDSARSVPGIATLPGGLSQALRLVCYSS